MHCQTLLVSVPAHLLVQLYTRHRVVDTTRGLRQKWYLSTVCSILSSTLSGYCSSSQNLHGAASTMSVSHHITVATHKYSLHRSVQPPKQYLATRPCSTIYLAQVLRGVDTV